MWLERLGQSWPRSWLVKSRLQALIREFGIFSGHQTREHPPISVLLNDADNHAIKGLCYWLCDRIVAVRSRRVMRAARGGGYPRFSLSKALKPACSKSRS